MRRDELKPDQLADALRGHTLGRGNERGGQDVLVGLRGGAPDEG